jgi:hypothetical protein
MATAALLVLPIEIVPELVPVPIDVVPEVDVLKAIVPLTFALL